jgi:membrane-associated phospholipid phosphatase
MPPSKAKPNQFALGIFLFASLAAAVGALILFGWLAEEVMEGDTSQFDAAIRGAIHNHATPLLTTAMQVFSFLGSVGWVTSIGVLVVCACFYFKRRRMAAFLAIAVVGAGTLDYVLKLTFRRPRPLAFFGTSPSSFSFPSGHALGSFCFYGILAAVLSDRMVGRKARFLIWLAAALLVGLIGLSRIYLGVHYPSDVIAGYLAGAMWVTAVTIVDKILLDRREKKINIAKILQ